MRVHNRQKLIPFDVDDTLSIQVPKGTVGAIKLVDPYDGETVYRLPHLPHIKLMKNYHARGAHIWVWSKNGVEWAKTIINALGLRKYVHDCSEKPYVYVDDMDATKWMGERVYIRPDDKFGRENAE